MPRIPHWARKSRSPTLAYRNTKTDARAVLHRAPDSYRYTWRGVILAEGYPIWVRGSPTKEAAAFREALRERPAPELACPDCGTADVVVGEKAADGAAVERWFDCPACGHEAPSRIVYGAER
jgi:predicted RNA-binding Zn-ribbon protein involved in translation (DUF1610 family)